MENKYCPNSRLKCPSYKIENCITQSICFQCGHAAAKEQAVEAVRNAMADWSNVWCVADAAIKSIEVKHDTE
jgi:hypothetical protein